MTAHNIDIELPPLPPLYIVPSVEPVDYPEVAQALIDYARAAVEADRKQHDRMLAHEWIRPALGLSEDAPYRFDFYAQEIEKLRNDSDYCKRMGEPYAQLIVLDEDDAWPQLVYLKGVNLSTGVHNLYLTPQPAETGGTHTIHNDHSGSQNGNQNLQPDEPDLVKCSECGAEMIHVRPGKWQHPDCSQSHLAAEPVVTDAPVPSDDLQGLSDRAYCQYIEQMRRPECLGWEQKVKDGRFGEAELKAHTKAGEFLGRHHAFSEAAALLARYGKVVDESTRKWKRIEEYSREVDGKKIDIYLGDFLLYCPHLEDEENNGVVIGYYSESYRGWYTSETLEEVFPTHFMPLPEKPL